MLDLLHPIYQPTASYGHFGRKPKEISYVDGAGKKHKATAFSWEKTDKRRRAAQGRRAEEVSRQPIAGRAAMRPPSRPHFRAAACTSPVHRGIDRGAVECRLPAEGRCDRNAHRGQARRGSTRNNGAR